MRVTKKIKKIQSFLKEMEVLENEIEKIDSIIELVIQGDCESRMEFSVKYKKKDKKEEVLDYDGSLKNGNSDGYISQYLYTLGSSKRESDEIKKKIKIDSKEMIGLDILISLKKFYSEKLASMEIYLEKKDLNKLK